MDDLSSTSRVPRHAWIDPLIVGAIVALAIALDGWPATTRDAATRIAFAAPVAALLGAIAATVSGRWRWPAFLVAAAATATCVLPTLWPKLDAGQWSIATLLGIGTAIVVVMIGVLIAIERLVARGEAVLAGLILVGMSLATAALVGFNGSARLATWTLGVAAAALVATVAVPWRGLSLGVSASLLAILAAQLTSGRFWLVNDLPLWQAASVAIAPFLGLAAIALPPLARRRKWLRVAIALCIAALPAIVACAVAGEASRRSFAPSSNTDDASYYGY